MKPDLGISKIAAESISEELSKLLADYFTVYLKTLKYHWNVTGPFFNTLHSMFAIQYKDLAKSVDVIAEKIRTLGEKAPATFAEFQNLRSIQDDLNDSHYLIMLKNLIDDHEYLIKECRYLFDLAGKSNDLSTQDLMVKQIKYHEKSIWVMGSFADEESFEPAYESSDTFDGHESTESWTL